MDVASLFSLVNFHTINCTRLCHHQHCATIAGILPVSFVNDADNEFVYPSMNRKSVHADTMNTATTRDRLFKTFCDQEGTIRSGQRLFRLCVDEGTGNVVVEWTDTNNPWEASRWAPR